MVTRHRQGRSTVGAGAAATSPLVRLLRGEHYAVRLSNSDWERLLTWIDTYGQRQGSFSAEQADELRALRREVALLLAPRPDK